MTRRRLGLALVGVLMVTLVACSSSDSKQLDIGKAKSRIDALATNVYSKEAKVANVKCPKSVPLEKGLVFFCTVDIDGAPLRIRLKQNDAKGNVRIQQADAVIFTSKLADFVVAYAGEHNRPGSTVDCGKASVITGPPGKVLTCKVTFANGKSGVAKVVVNDTNGKVGLTSLKAAS